MPLTATEQSERNTRLLRRLRELDRAVHALQDVMTELLVDASERASFMPLHIEERVRMLRSLMYANDVRYVEGGSGDRRLEVSSGDGIAWDVGRWINIEWHRSLREPHVEPPAAEHVEEAHRQGTPPCH